MVERFVEWVSSLGLWAYAAIFIVVSLESAAFLGFLMPGETLVFLGGFLASPAGKNVLDARVLVPLVAVAAILGDTIGYELGRYLQKPWFLHYGRWIGINETHWQRLEEHFARHCGKTVFFARFSAFFRILVPFFAGAVGVRYPRFLQWNILGGILWAVGSVALGYVAGASWHVLHRWIGRAATVLILVLIIIVLIVRHSRRKRDPSPS